MQNDSSENQVDIIPMILCILEKIFTYVIRKYFGKQKQK